MAVLSVAVAVRITALPDGDVETRREGGSLSSVIEGGAVVVEEVVDIAAAPHSAE